MLRENFRKIGAFILAFALLSSPNIYAAGTGSSKAETVYKAAKKKYVLMRVSESKVKLRDSWIDVIDTFLSVYLEYPESERGDDSLYMVGRLYEELYGQSKNSMDLYRAIEIYDKLTQEYPDSRLADDARFKIAEIYHFGLKSPDYAFKNYQRVVDEYPKGDMMLTAAERLKSLAKYAGEKAIDEGAPRDVKKEEVKPDIKTHNGTTVTDIRTSFDGEKTRVVFDLSENAEYTYGHLKDDPQNNLPNRIYVDIKKGARGKNLKEKIVLKDGLVTEIRTGGTDPGLLRIVMDIKGPSDYKIFPLKSPDRIVVDILSKEDDKGEDVTNTKEEIDVTPPKKTPKTDIKVVVIDAGHGGRDPGAVGPTRYYEKTANYKIANYLREYLKSRLGLKVIMTRETDKYLTLKDRTALANKSNADLFISIHNNASRDRSVFGVSTYYLAVTSDRKALAVAARENDTTIERLTELDYILTDLMVSAKRNESSLLAKFVQDGMVLSLKDGYTDIKDDGIMQGPFWVLVGAQMPSILVECSYISNVREEKRLKSESYLKKIAYGIYKGFEKYINEIDKAKENW
ncbi:MAG: N-acetylmuramoyl-L-alanine amidase [Deltaproteobacteria bacterium]|uniref:N-acetylmuramoyl-L-alanine amidase n=1 Tax=Candidatus Zymogenus saltonus TaxID=2844893 RepID=A0A9D8KCQ3_9DELT|nr:N-acetylmuramoyl-L-alanine amidase [Candidatus Zymogenus saltonus]